MARAVKERPFFHNPCASRHDIIKREEIQMGIIKRSELTPEIIAPGRTRYLAYTDQLMMVVMIFMMGPLQNLTLLILTPMNKSPMLSQGKSTFS